MPVFHRLAILLILLCASLAASAQEGVYIVEMLVFEQPDAYDEPGQFDEVNTERRIAGSLELGAPGVIPLPAQDGGFGPVIYTLRHKGARVLAHLRWRHDFSIPTSTDWLRLTNPYLDGVIRLRRGRFIHLDTDLQIIGSEQPVREHGRMRSGELLYVDHPRAGILIRAERVDTPKPQPTPGAPAATQEPPAPPPKPATDNPPEPPQPAREIPRALPDPT